jgi:peptide/nickel transport system ATP-binding protein/glutathione transport system ATP-binding protein
MYFGHIFKVGSRHQVFEKPRHPYTQAIMKGVSIAVPKNRKSERDLNFKPIPSPIHETRYVPKASVYDEVGPGHLALTTNNGYYYGLKTYTDRNFGKTGGVPYS